MCFFFKKFLMLGNLLLSSPVFSFSTRIAHLFFAEKELAVDFMVIGLLFIEFLVFRQNEFIEIGNFLFQSSIVVLIFIIYSVYLLFI